jgi:peptidyl-prolyl cis-trans isomerase B (cyclophilin B)
LAAACAELTVEFKLKGMVALAALSLAFTLSAPTDRPQVKFEVEGRGSFVMELRPDQAPKLVAHFLNLVDSGFYDKMLFHRKVDKFVLQGGDPGTKKVSVEWAKKNPGEMGGTKSLGSGGSGKEVPYEINDLTHVKHSVGMALSSPMSDTGDSQFFINLKDNFRLNGMYCVFGQVVSGNGLINKIERGDRIIRVSRVKAKTGSKS